MHQRQQRGWMRMKRLLLIPLFCLVLCICIGCNSSSQTKIQARDCQTVEHASGQSCIPRIPQRVVVTDEIALDAVLALDVQPIAAAESTLVRSRARHLANSLDGITSIGRESEPNLERLVELNPDLILGFNSAKTHYRSLSQIAPTVALGYEHTDWKADLEKIGAMLGRGDRAQQQLADYQKRIAEFRAARLHLFRVASCKISGYPDRSPNSSQLTSPTVMSA
jgi:iron complex transport system substrate-binding protein